MKAPDLKALSARLTETTKKVSAAEELMSQKETALSEAKTEDEKQKATEALETAKIVVKDAADEFETVAKEVEDAKAVAAKRSREKAVQDELKAIMDPDTSDGQITGKGRQVDTDVAGPNPAAEVKDWLVQERAHYEAFKAFVCDEEDTLGSVQRDLIQGKALEATEARRTQRQAENKSGGNPTSGYRREALLPKSVAAMFLGGQAIYDPIRGKVVLSIDNAVTNPSLAHNLVPQEFRPQLLQLPMPPSPIYNQVTRIPSNTGEVTWPTLAQSDGAEFGGVAFEWVDEAESKPETEPQFNQITITAHELAGYTELSHKILIRSAIALEPLLSSLYRAGIADELERVIINGTGTGQPLGVLQTIGIHPVNRAVAGTVGYQDLVDLKYAVQFYHRQGARWCMGDDVEQDLVGDVDADGRPLYSTSIASGPYDRLLGHPFDVSYRSPTLGNSGDVLWGAWKYYYLVVEEDVTIAKSDHFRFRSNRRAIKVFINVGGRLTQPRAFSYLAPVTGS